MKRWIFKQVYIAQLAEKIWLELPSREVVKTPKAAYGLCQSVVERWKELGTTFWDAGWKTSAYEECLYYPCESKGKIAIRTMYVGDLLLTEDGGEEI